VGPRALGALAAALCVALAVPATAFAPARKGELVPGKSLGEVHLGMTKAEVLDEWGTPHGVCRDCVAETWYFNYDPFQPQGTGVIFDKGEVVAAFTVWRPTGWKTPEGLELGADGSEVARTYGSLDKRECTSYEALLLPGKKVTSVFYVFRDKLWGFGLMKPDASPCL